MISNGDGGRVAQVCKLFQEIYNKLLCRSSLGILKDAHNFKSTIYHFIQQEAANHTPATVPEHQDFFRRLAAFINDAGVNYGNRLIFPCEIEDANTIIENNRPLEQAWPQMREAIIDSNPGLPVIKAECGADEIREWLSSNLNALQNVRGFNLGNIGLKALPPEIGLFTGLWICELQFNHLITLPPEIGQLVNLRILCLAHNQLSAIPKEIGQLANLDHLFLNNNLLTPLSFPTEISQLANLHYLSIGNNPHPLTDFPEDMFPPNTILDW